MLTLTVDITIKPENIESFLKQAVENAVASRAEPGCRQFEVLVDPKDRSRVMLFEIYDDEAAFDEHQKSANFQKYLTNAVPLLAARKRHFWNRLTPTK
jgi:quinol monooxygenase YgiN